MKRLVIKKLDPFSSAKEIVQSIPDQRLKEVLLFRLEVVESSEKYGVRETLKTFGISKATLFRWRLLWKRKGLKGLTPGNFSSRKRMWRNEVIEFIAECKKADPFLGKRKIKLLCDEFCRKKGIPSPSVSTVGRILKYLKDLESSWNNLTVRKKRTY